MTTPASPADPRRHLPQLSSLLEEERIKALIAAHSRPLVVEALRGALEDFRSTLKAGDAVPAREEILAAAEERLLGEERERLRPVVNATGVVLHTNLGRAVLPRRAARALAGLDHCCNLQIDMATGARGKRNYLSERLICRLTGAEAAVVVNNNAAATLLVLAALCAGREVVVSRGQLIEIGGAFRLPDCIRQSGARMVEVGTTNKTHLRDYAAALSEATGALLRVNPSNYRVVGFHKEVSTSELASLTAGREGLLVIDDLGCGALLNLEELGLPHEPTVQESLSAGADVALFSGDKLIGGPQAGIIVGRRELIQQIKKHPLTRMMRVDKLTDLALEQTLRLFLEPREVLLQENPTLRMLATPLAELKRRAQRLARRAQKAAPGLIVRAVASESAVGGGTLPATPLGTWCLAVSSGAMGAEALSARLRRHEPPVIARIEAGQVLLDLRTIFDDEEPAVLAALAALGRGAAAGESVN